VGSQRHASAALPPGKRPSTHCGWTAGSVGIGTESLLPVGCRSLDRPVRSRSQYRLLYSYDKDIENGYVGVAELKSEYKIFGWKPHGRLGHRYWNDIETGVSEVGVSSFGVSETGSE